MLLEIRIKFAALASHGLTEFIPILRFYLARRVIEHFYLSITQRVDGHVDLEAHIKHYLCKLGNGLQWEYSRVQELL